MKPGGSHLTRDRSLIVSEVLVLTGGREWCQEMLLSLQQEPLSRGFKHWSRIRRTRYDHYILVYAQRWQPIKRTA